MEELLEYEFKNTLRLFKDKNIPIGDIVAIRINKKLSPDYGRCIAHHVPWYDSWEYEIEISPCRFKDIESLRETLVHEMCHTIQGAVEHNQVWRYWFDYAMKLIMSINLQ